MHITLTKNMHECFLFIYFYLVKFSCQNTISIFEKKNFNESNEIRMEKKCRKMKKKENFRGFGRYVTIFPLFFSYFSYSSSSSSLLHCTVEARAQFGSGVRFKSTRKECWKGKQGQNDLLLAQKK